MKAKMRRPRRIVELILDTEAAATVGTLEALLDRTPDGPTGKEITKQLQAAHKAADTSRVPVILEAVSHTGYKALQAAHPSTPERLAEVREATGEDWAVDPDEFAPVLVHAQLISPRTDSEEEFRAFWADLSDGQVRALFTAALAAQTQVTALGPLHPRATA
jgi:hypothetical protein